MKKILLILVSLLLLSCFNYDENLDNEFYSRINREDIFFPSDINYIDNSFYIDGEQYLFNENNYSIFSKYVSSRVLNNDDIIDTWSTTKTILDRGYGDCEDQTKVFLLIYYLITGVKGDMVLVYYNVKSIISGGNVNHAMVKIGDDIFNPTIGDITHTSNVSNIGYIYTFDELF